MLNLLYANDRKGTYPPSWYAASTPLLDPFPALKGHVRADVCIVGGGYTGLSAALHLADAGRRVVLLEAQRVGFGASGRNGGQLGSGQRVEQPYLAQMLGPEKARTLWNYGEEAKALVRELITRHGIDCHLKPGVAWAVESRGDLDDMKAYADYMAQHHDYPIALFEGGAFDSVCPSPRFRGGILDMGAGHLHPLAFALGLARAAAKAGVTIHEGSAVHDIHPSKRVTLRTDTGQVEADQVILACNGYLGGLDRKVAAHVMPINNFIIATEPLGDAADKVLPRDVAVSDARFVVNYFRLSHDKRLLFGGGESYGYRFPKDIEALVRKPMARLFPHLRDVKIDYAWGGTLAITMKRLPFLVRLAPNMLSASGYSGHGLGTATHTGQLMAKALMGQSEGFDTMAAIPATPFPGGPALRSPLLVLAMTWYAMRDRLGL